MKLNHVANRISKGSLDILLALFTEELGFRLLRRIPTDIWLRQGESSVDIQFCETDAPTVGFDKHNSHITFLSDNPEKELQKLSEWFNSRGFETKIGSWSSKEFWLDVPEVFVDFTIESMTPDLADYKI